MLYLYSPVFALAMFHFSINKIFFHFCLFYFKQRASLEILDYANIVLEYSYLNSAERQSNFVHFRHT